LELETELLLHRREQRRRVGIGRREFHAGRRVQRPFGREGDLEVPPTAQPGAIDDDTLHLSGQVAREQGHWHRARDETPRQPAYAADNGTVRPGRRSGRRSAARCRQHRCAVLRRRFQRRSELSIRPRKHQLIDIHLACFPVHGQLESLGQQRAHRHHVGIRSAAGHHRWRVALHLRHDVEGFVANPPGILDELKRLQLIGKRDQRSKRHVGRLQTTAGKAADARSLHTRLVRFDRRGFVGEHDVRIGRLCRCLGMRA